VIVKKGIMIIMRTMEEGKYSMNYQKKGQRRGRKRTEHGGEDELWIRFEAFTAVTMENGVFWDVTQRASVASYS
jgi:hypothetical protein